MFSKWFDTCANIAAYHYQSTAFEALAPPAFGNYPEVRCIPRNRKRDDLMTLEDYQTKLDADMSMPESATTATTTTTTTTAANSSKHKGLSSFLKNRLRNKRKNTPKPKHRRLSSDHKAIHTPENTMRKSIFASFQIGGVKLEDTTGSSDNNNIASVAAASDEPIATPFLQESVHLFSLLSAVALTTLRNDIPQVEAPLAKWEPDDPFPPVDPDNLSKEIRREEYGGHSKIWTSLYFIVGISRSPRQRTLYNHARPFKVLGGISDNEVDALCAARGPYAKVALCFLWIQEFITREQLNGGLGPIPSPIVSRCYQFCSDGMKGYNDCRKIAYIPFPFVHEQLTVIFISVILLTFPVLFYSFVNNIWLACLLNYSTVLCFVGLHEVAREMETPFMRVPNNLPLTTFQAQFNEALITTWAGFHPDSWFDLPEVDLPDISESGSDDSVEETSPDEPPPQVDEPPSKLQR